MHNNLIAFLSLVKQNKLPQDVQMVSIGAWDASQLDVNYFFMWDQEKIDMYNKYTHDTFDCTVSMLVLIMHLIKIINLNTGMIGQKNENSI